MSEDRPGSVARSASNPVLTHKGGVRCNMLTGALVPRRGTVAGVPGPRRTADECDAGWFAPVATRRRSIPGGPPAPWLTVSSRGRPPGTSKGAFRAQTPVPGRAHESTLRLSSLTTLSARPRLATGTPYAGTGTPPGVAGPGRRRGV